MFLIVLIALLTGLKFFDVGFMTDVSWWWVTGLFLLALLWFEVFEHVLGFDKKRAHKHYEEMLKKPVKNVLKKRM